MALTWEDFVDAWRQGSINGNADLLQAMITDDFTWPTSEMDRQMTVNWLSTTDFRISDPCITLYENNDVIVGMHGVHGEGHYNMVMGCAYIRDGKIYKYHHQRKIAE